MKFLVDKIPENASKCQFSKWIPNPPIFEETGRFVCKLDKKTCNLIEKGCRHMKELEPQKED